MEYIVFLLRQKIYLCINKFREYQIKHSNNLFEFTMLIIVVENMYKYNRERLIIV